MPAGQMGGDTTDLSPPIPALHPCRAGAEGAQPLPSRHTRPSKASAWLAGAPPHCTCPELGFPCL